LEKIMKLGWLCKTWMWTALFIALTTIRAFAEESSSPTDLGYDALKAGDWEKALKDFNEAILAEPKNAAGYHGRGIAYWKMDKQDLAILDLNKAIELNRTKATAFRTRGAFFLEKGDLERAIADCNDAISLDPKDAIPFSNRGYAYLEKGDAEKAISDFTEALRLNPKFIRAYMNRGFTWYQQRDYDLAIADMDKVLGIDPNDAGALLIRGASSSGQGDLNRGLADLNNAIRINPNLQEAYLQRANIRLSRNEIEEATADFNEVIRIDPNSSDAYLYRATCFSKIEKYAEALVDVERAIELKPNSPCHYEIRGVLWIECGNFERGIKDIQTAIRLNPTDLAAKFEAWEKKPLTSELLIHGERQVEQMLHDRPQMSGHGAKAKIFYQWAARKFAGEDLGQKIFWNSAELPQCFNSKNWTSSSTQASEGYISVRGKYVDGPNKGEERSFEELWCDVVFELYNIANSQDFYQLNKEAAEGKLSKNKYIMKIIECEYNAAEKTRAFYICMFLEWVKDQKLATHPICWYLAKKSNPQDNFILRDVSNNMPYWRSYEHKYDLITLYSLVDKGNTERALELAEEIYKQMETKEERAAIGLPRGYCLLKSKQPVPAIDALNEYIIYDSGNVTAYLTRATAFAMLPDMDRAIVDYDKAIHLDPLNSEAFKLRGDAYEAMGDKKRAEADFAKAKQLIETSEKVKESK
jgi:tetratricopeptide (TPR) repeat protein